MVVSLQSLLIECRVPQVEAAGRFYIVSESSSVSQGLRQLAIHPLFISGATTVDI